MAEKNLTTENGKTAKNGKDTKATKKEEQDSKKAAKKEEPTKQKQARYSRSQGFLAALALGPATKTELAERMDNLFSKANSKPSNMAESKFWTTNYLRLMEDLGLLATDDAGKISIKEFEAR